MRGPVNRLEVRSLALDTPHPQGGVSKVRTQNFWAPRGVLKMLIFGPPSPRGGGKGLKCSFLGRLRWKSGSSSSRNDVLKHPKNLDVLKHLKASIRQLSCLLEGAGATALN